MTNRPAGIHCWGKKGEAKIFVSSPAKDLCERKFCLRFFLPGKAEIE